MEKYAGFWPSVSHTTYLLSDVRIDIFIGATGRAEITLPIHSIFLLEAPASTFHAIGNDPPSNAEFLCPTLVFIPRKITVICSPTKPFDVVMIAMPDHWFAGEMRGQPIYEDTLFSPFQTVDPIMLQIACLLKSIAIERPKLSKRDSIDALLGSLARRSIWRACLDQIPQQQAITAKCLALVQKFVDGRLGGEIRLLDLAEVAGMSQFHFSRAFKVAMNETPMRYVLGRRIAAAKLALSGTGSLIAIAHDAGFASQSHFTTSFRQATGETPAVWRAGKR